MCFDTERIGNARLRSIVVGSNSYTAFDAETRTIPRSATLSLCDLPGLHTFVVGNYSLFPIAQMKLMSCHGICYSSIDICEGVTCRFGDHSMYMLSLESTSSL